MGDAGYIGVQKREEHLELVVFTPKAGPGGVLVLWDDHKLEGGAFHEEEEFPVHGGADRLCAQAGWLNI